MLKPPGFTTVFPYIFVDGGDAYLRFLVDGLGGDVTHITRGPGDRLANGQVRFDDTMVMVSEAHQNTIAQSWAYTLALQRAQPLAAGTRSCREGTTYHQPSAELAPSPTAAAGIRCGG